MSLLVWGKAINPKPSILECGTPWRMCIAVLYFFEVFSFRVFEGSVNNVFMGYDDYRCLLS